MRKQEQQGVNITPAQLRAERLRNGEIRFVTIDRATFQKTRKEREVLALAKGQQKHSSRIAKEKLVKLIVTSPTPKWGGFKMAIL